MSTSSLEKLVATSSWLLTSWNMSELATPPGVEDGEGKDEVGLKTAGGEVEADVEGRGESGE